jgi:hypothetical protein
VADREFVFAHPDVQKLLREKFVTVALDDWYLRRQQDEAGRFFRSVADQGPRKGEGGGTRQGRYVFTAGGKLLGFNNNRSPERILAMLRESQGQWEKLEKAVRSPAPPAAGKADAAFSRKPPPDAAVIKLHTRVLETSAAGFTRCAAEKSEDFRQKGFGAAIDHMWLRAGEITPPPDDKPMPLTPEIATRIARFHLTDSTRGEPAHWTKSEVKHAALTLTRQKDGTIALTGDIHLETADGKRGLLAKALGTLKFDGAKLAQFDVTVLGDHWGDSQYTRGARPGRTPIGFAFALIPEPLPADLVPPQAARWMDGYWKPSMN